MIRKSDVQWWVLEASNNPQAAPEIINELARRLEELDAENERLRNEALRYKGAPASSGDKSEVETLSRRVDTLKSILDGQASAEPAIVFVSSKLQAARIPLSQVRLRLRQNQPALDRTAVHGLSKMLLARPHNDLVVLTNQGRAIKLALHNIPFLAEENDWPPADETLLAPGERVTAAAVAESPRFWTIATHRGFVRQFLNIRLNQLAEDRKPLFASPIANDSPVILVNGDRGDLLLCSRWGKAARFPQHKIGGQGSAGMIVEQDDDIAAALPISSESEVVVLTASGYAIRRDVESIKSQNKPGGDGRPLIQAFDVLDAVLFASRGKLVYLTYSGKLAQSDISSMPLHTRFGKGTQIIDLSRDPAIAAVFVPGALL
ncbi:MAG: hypothetical protein JXA42_03835 [Anaerolineales bacterium]|nr:hypothetical protein [Anaerolineales bacterium]